MPNRPVKKTVMPRRHGEAAQKFFGRRLSSTAAPGSEAGREESVRGFPSCAAGEVEDSRAPASNATAPHTTLIAASSQADRRSPSAGTMTNVLARIPTTAPSVLDA